MKRLSFHLLNLPSRLSDSDGESIQPTSRRLYNGTCQQTCQTNFALYYRKNKKIPVFAYVKKGFIPEEALQLISGVSRKHSSDVCTDHPVG